MNYSLSSQYPFRAQVKRYDESLSTIAAYKMTPPAIASMSGNDQKNARAIPSFSGPIHYRIVTRAPYTTID